MSLRRSARTPIQRVTYASSVTTVPQKTGIQQVAATKVVKKTSIKKTTKASVVQDEAYEASQYRYDQTTTPTKRRKLSSAAPTDPVTPTPAAAKFIGHSYASKDIDVATPPPEARRPSKRPAQPHMTNALLRTPKGTRVSAATQVNDSNQHVEQAAANDTGAETTTQNLLDVAEAHLIKVDPRLKRVIDENRCHVFTPEGLAEEVDPFESLVSSIMAQQVSGAAASAIKKKFVGLFNDDAEQPAVFPSPEEVAKTDVPRLRQAGLSQRKAEYVQGVAEKFATGELSAQMLANASDEEVLAKLVAVRGLGVWSVEMFMCFALKRMDILSVGDLGVQRGMAAHQGRDVAKLKAKGGKWKYMSEKEMLEISAKFTPYRSLYMWLMWRVEDVDVGAMQNS